MYVPLPTFVRASVNYLSEFNGRQNNHTIFNVGHFLGKMGKMKRSNTRGGNHLKMSAASEISCDFKLGVKRFPP